MEESVKQVGAEGKLLLAKIKEKVVPCEVYSRVVGYHRPVQSWNKGKCEEFRQRKEYDTEASLVSCRAKPVPAPDLKSF